ADRRISGHKEQMPRSKHPQTGLPFRSFLAEAALKWKHESRWLVQTALENPSKPLAFLGILEFVVFGINVDRKLPLLVYVGERVLVGCNDAFRIDRQRSREFFRESLCLFGTEAIIALRAGDPFGIVPERQAVRSPVTAERPSGQRLARIPFAL